VSTAPRRRRSARPTTAAGGFPDWVAPQLTKLVETVPEGDQWAHEIKLDGYRMHACVDRGRVRLLTRTGLDWTDKYPTTAEAFTALPIEQAYIDGELCAVAENGVTSFSLMQAATDSRRTASLMYFAFDLLYADGENLIQAPLVERKRRLDTVLHGHTGPIRYCDHQVGRGPEFHTGACKLGLEGVVSKRLDAPYIPNDRGLWLKTKCLNREEFVIVGWTDPEGTRRAPAGVLRPGGSADIRGACCNRHERRRTGARVAPVAAAQDQHNAAGDSPSADQPVRLAPRSVARALGAA
jgi:DNA ligase D-like protein (predicted ligase)